MRHKIAVFGSAEGEFDQIIKKTHELGESLGKQKVTVITGASTGLPYEAAYQAYLYGAKIWGYSPATNEKDHATFAPGTDIRIYEKLFFVPKSFPFAMNLDVCKKYRNVISTTTCDAGIIISGRWGTMNEFTNLYDMGKIIGVLTRTGGIADELPTLTQKIKKKSKAKVIFSNSPRELVTKITQELRNVS